MPRGAFVTYQTGPKAGQLSSAYCKSCKKHATAISRGNANYKPREYYRLSSEDKKNQRIRYRKQKVDRLRNYIASVLIGATCADCPETDWTIFHFDHRDPSQKNFDISDIRSGSYSLDRLKGEIAKCDIVCPSCHARRTNNMFGTWRLNWKSPTD